MPHAQVLYFFMVEQKAIETDRRVTSGYNGNQVGALRAPKVFFIFLFEKKAGAHEATQCNKGSDLIDNYLI